jgi:hypothetical protein
MDHRLRDRGLREQHFLHPFGRDVAAEARDQQVRFAALDDQPAGCIDPSDISGRDRP